MPEVGYDGVGGLTVIYYYLVETARQHGCQDTIELPMSEWRIHGPYSLRRDAGVPAGVELFATEQPDPHKALSEYKTMISQNRCVHVDVAGEHLYDTVTLPEYEFLARQHRRHEFEEEERRRRSLKGRVGSVISWIRDGVRP